MVGMVSRASLIWSMVTCGPLQSNKIKMPSATPQKMEMHARMRVHRRRRGFRSSSNKYNNRYQIAMSAIERSGCWRLLDRLTVKGRRRLVKKEESNRAQAQADIQNKTRRERSLSQETNPRKPMNA